MNEIVIEPDARINYKNPSSWQPILLADFSASFRAVLRLQLSTVLRRSKTILYEEENASGDLKMLGGKPFNGTVYNNARIGLDVFMA